MTNISLFNRKIFEDCINISTEDSFFGYYEVIISVGRDQIYIICIIFEPKYSSDVGT